MKSERFLIDWLPPLVWSVVILSASNDAFSSAHTANWLQRLAGLLTQHPLAPHTRDLLNLVFRKGAHLVNYGILGALAFRAVRGDRPSWRLRWAIGAIGFVVCIATIDEIHQSFVPSRTGRWEDVLLDAGGAAAAQLIIRAAQVLLFRTS
jgi:VanZ family protein